MRKAIQYLIDSYNLSCWNNRAMVAVFVFGFVVGATFL